jgi:N-acetyl-alpha-D-glucosaminyl L-malate synthase BshA
MPHARPLRIGITCYPSVGGSGILASALGEELARRGHEVHFISSERPFRLPDEAPRIYYHSVRVNDYELFKYPDYTLPLSVKMAEVSRERRLDILHVHYAVPHATAAILARWMLPIDERPCVVTTLHGTDTTLLGRDPAYGPAIEHALAQSDAVTAVSAFLKRETQELFAIGRPIEVIHNFFVPRAPTRTRGEVRHELGVRNESLLIHSSNLRPLKRIDVLLEAVARIEPRESFKLLILAGGSFEPFRPLVERLGLTSRVVVRDNVRNIEDFLQAADIGLVTSDSESFCLSILEAMCFACPAVATRVGGIPEVLQDDVSGRLVPAGDVAAVAAAVEDLIGNVARRRAMGAAAQQDARRRFSADVIVPQYEELYRRCLAGLGSPARISD